MSCEKYKIENISEQECIGDSLEEFNNNFNTLRNAYCDIRTELNNRLRIMNQSVPLPEYTETIVFSGTRVSVKVTPGDDPYDTTDELLTNGVHKTVFIPVTGVTQILAGNYITLESTQPSGKGVVTVNFELPPRPKQIRTFMYYEDGNNNALSRPSYTRLQTFINSQLKIGSNVNLPITTNSYNTDISRENDEIYIVYFKTARNVTTIAAGGSVTYTGYSAGLKSGPSFGGGESGRPSTQYIRSDGTANYTMSWPSDTAERSVLTTITYKFRYSGTEYIPVINDETGQWPKYSYSLHATPAGDGLAIPPPSDIAAPIPQSEEVVVRLYTSQVEPFVVPENVTTIELLVVGAGGGGGIGAGGAGGGGGGGYYYNKSFTVRPGGVYNIVVGAGGQPGTNDARQYGGNSEFTIASLSRTVNDAVFCRGGGSGANGSGFAGGDGASGGGAAGTVPINFPNPGNPLVNTFSALPFNVPQGFKGGTGASGRGGGGGGAGGLGGNAAATTGGQGGNGVSIPFDSSILTGQVVCAGGAGGVDNTIGGTSYTQLADPIAGSFPVGGDVKYGCGGGAGLAGSNGVVGVAYRQRL